MTEAAQPEALPGRARLLLGCTAVAAVLLSGGAIVVGGLPGWAAVVLAVGIAGGEFLRVDLPHRGGGNASFGLGDAALAAGLLLLAPSDVVAGAVGGMALLQVVERVRPVKFFVNVAQYAAGAATAALAVHVLTPEGADVGPINAVIVTFAILLFLAVNVTTVAGMISLTSGRPFGAILWRLVPTGALLAVGDAALAVIAIALADTTPWAIPGLAVPLGLLFYASRQAIQARVDRERSAAFAEVEHALGAAATPAEIAGVLAAGTTAVLGCRGMVWLDGRWATDVPGGSSRCPLDGELDRVLAAPAPTLGLPLQERALAMGVGHGMVMVVVRGELGLGADAEEWVDRLARSGRVHHARAAAGSALQHERATLSAVVNGTRDGVLLLRGDGTVAVWNPAMARLSGITADEAVDRPISAVLGEGPWQEDGIHDVDRPSAEAIWRISVAGLEDRHVSSDGRACVVAVHDVTAERRAARARDDMLGVVSHELRTPLTPIVASAQLLLRRKDRLDPERRDVLVSQIEERAQHLSRLIDDLLLVGQLSAGDQVVPRLAPTPIDVGGLVVEASDGVQMAWPTHEIRAVVDGDCVVSTDPTRVRQVLDNLLDNACKFSTPGSVVNVEVAGAEDHLHIAVRDEGRGIPPSHLERVFQQFARVEDPLVMTTSGAGLGLYIVQHVVAALGGTVDLRSRVGQGTTVTVTLPRPVPSAVPERTVSASTTSGRAG